LNGNSEYSFLTIPEGCSAHLFRFLKTYQGFFPAGWVFVRVLVGGVVGVAVGVEVKTGVGVTVGVRVFVQTGANEGITTAWVVGVEVMERWDIAGPMTPI
jgi:hypothetical protein